MITAAQLRAARGLLDWTRNELAAAAKVSPETVKNIEHGVFRPQEQTAEAIIRAFKLRKVEFVDETGVKLIEETVKIIDGPSAYYELLNLILESGAYQDEILFMFADNKVSPPEVVEVQKRLRDAGAKFRFIVDEGNDFYRYPKKEYRKVAKNFFNHDVIVIFSDHVATLIDKGAQILIVHNASLAETNRRIFNFIWAHGKEVI